MDDLQNMRIALEHMMERNMAFFEEYEKWADLSAALGKPDVWDMIRTALEHAGKANEALRRAVDRIG
jgi:hypothetical protein